MQIYRANSPKLYVVDGSGSNTTFKESCGAKARVENVSVRRFEAKVAKECGLWLNVYKLWESSGKKVRVISK